MTTYMWCPCLCARSFSLRSILNELAQEAVPCSNLHFQNDTDVVQWTIKKERTKRG
jgi:hypothetical protein